MNNEAVKSCNLYAVALVAVLAMKFADVTGFLLALTGGLLVAPTLLIGVIVALCLALIRKSFVAAASVGAITGAIAATDYCRSYLRNVDAMATSTSAVALCVCSVLFFLFEKSRLEDLWRETGAPMKFRELYARQYARCVLPGLALAVVLLAAHFAATRIGPLAPWLGFLVPAMILVALASEPLANELLRTLRLASGPALNLVAAVLTLAVLYTLRPEAPDWWPHGPVWSLLGGIVVTVVVTVPTALMWMTLAFVLLWYEAPALRAAALEAAREEKTQDESELTRQLRERSARNGQ
jgi:hypothetical protein